MLKIVQNNLFIYRANKILIVLKKISIFYNLSNFDKEIDKKQD